MEDYIDRSDYGDDGQPPLAIGLVITPPTIGNQVRLVMHDCFVSLKTEYFTWFQWSYRIRTNYSKAPATTNGNIDKFSTSFDLVQWAQYGYDFVMPLKMVLDQVRFAVLCALSLCIVLLGCCFVCGASNDTH